jgi:hypothetical protein
LLLLSLGCSGDPARLAEQLASRDPVLVKRLAPAPGTWLRDGERLTSPGWRSAKMGPLYEVGARLPAAADGAIEVGIGQSPDYTLRLWPEGARASSVEEDTGRASYRGAYPSTDVVYVADAQRVEWFLLLADRAAPTELAWRVELPKGLPLARREPSGALVFADRAGTTRLRMPRPFAVDARGTRREATLRFAHDRISVGLETDGLVFPILLDPAIETGVWTQTAGSRLSRTGHAMVYDSTRSRAVLFGGQGEHNLLDDTWEYDGAASKWIQVATTGSPAARVHHAMAFDRGRGRTVLFGGTDNAVVLGDTWEYDGATATWTQLTTTGSPSGRSGHAMAYDDARGRTVLCAGATASALVDTWEYDGATATWSQITTNGSPPARYFQPMVYDDARHRMVLFGGLTIGPALGDTWEYDGTTATWAQVTTTGSPSARFGHAMLYDSARSRTILFGGYSGGVLGDLWEYDGAASTWTQVTVTGGPAARWYSAMVYDSARGRTLLLGGDDNATTTFGDTWEYAGATAAWTQTGALGSPPARSFFGMAYDSTRGRTVLFGGANSFGDTWEYDGTTSTWAKIATSGSPSPRQHHAMAYDSARSRTVLYGGEFSGVSGDTWEYNGPTATWTQISTTGKPTATYGHGMVYDGARGRMVLFGGDGSGSRYLAETWEYGGANATWTRVTTTGAPSGRDDPAMAYDSARGRVVLFGGWTGGNPALTDTWEYSGATSTWTRVTTTSVPSARNDPAMAYDSVRGRIVLFSGNISGEFAATADTWEYNGAAATWSQLATVGSPPGRGGGSMVFDAARGRAVLFGGQSDGRYDDTWEYYARGGPCSCATGSTCASAACETGYCVDGVCCGGSSLASTSPPACGKCEGCNTAANPGVCTAITNFTSDPASCAAPKVCGSAGCGTQNGAACTFGASCASGFCIQGVCCSTVCNGPCDSCAKEFGALADGVCFTPAMCTAGRPLGASCQADVQCTTRHCVDGFCCGSACDGVCVACDLVPGTCMPATANTDPHGSCGGDGQCSGTCNGSGACTFPPSGMRCDTCKTCNGAGRCDQLPGDEDDLACGQVSCAALSTECATVEDVVVRRCAAVGLCAAPNDPATCTMTTAAPDGQPCAGGACRAGRCVPNAPVPAATQSGCELAPSHDPPGSSALILALFVLAVRVRRKRGWIARLLVAAVAGCGSSSPAPSTWQREAGGLTSPGWRSARMGPTYDVGARLPLTADGPVEVGIGQSPDYLLRLVPEGARASAVADDPGRASYRAAYPSTDVVFVAEARRVEWFLLLADTSAPTEFAWRIELPRGLPQVKTDPSGALLFADRAGTVRLRMPKPWAIDSRGVRRDATLAWLDGRLTVGLDTRGLAFPVLLDPAIESGSWLKTRGSQLPREAPAMVYDSGRKRAVLFAGHAHDFLGDTWEYDGATAAWQQRATNGSPAARYYHAMAYDSARGRVVLFGGQSGSGYAGDTWEYDGATATWTQITTTGGPSGRLSPAMVYDSARGRIVLFGGDNNTTTFLGDTWEYDGAASTWKQVTTTGSPPARQSHAMIYDSARHRVVLFGGAASSGALGDTWEYDGTTATWTMITTSGGPAPREYHAMAYDSARARVVLFGGLPALADAWEYDGSTATWTQIAPTRGPPGRQRHAMVYDSARARVVLFGGRNFTGVLGDTWEYDGASITWNESEPPDSPTTRSAAAMVYDSARARVVLFGGQNSSGTLADTWEYDGSSTTWTSIATTGAPGARVYSAMVYDSTRGRTILFGGLNVSQLGDTWQYDGATGQWTQVTTNGSPPALYQHAMVYDPARGRVVLFGGVANLPVGDTWEYDGTTATWKQITTTGSPAARHSCAMVYDEARGRIVLFGGASPASNGPFGDTWEYDGAIATWAPITTTGRPSARQQVAMVNDGWRRRIVLFGGWSGGGRLGDTWEYDGATARWTQALPAGGPSARFDYAMAFDDARGRAVVFGGNGDNNSNLVPLGDTWEYHTRGGPCACATGSSCANAACETGYCVDGVCCEGSSLASTSPPGCGVCQDCNTAASPGVCTTFTNETSDPDSCVAPKICGAAGCGDPKGTACSFGAACANGFCIQGVCCETLCNGPCDACAKAAGAAVDGVCFTPSLCTAGKDLGVPCQADGECQAHHCVDGVCCVSACDGLCVACNVVPGTCTPATAGSDPHGSCAGDPTCAGTCNGSGGCTFPPSGNRCDTCKACNGAGRCNLLPQDEDDPACGAISCAGLGTECASLADVSTRRCVALGLCASPNDPTICVSSSNLPDGTACSTGVCTNGLCGPATAPGNGKSSGCAMAPESPPPTSLILVLALGGLLRRLCRVKRAATTAA